MRLTTLLVARHGTVFAPGETSTRIGVRTDLPLSETGVEQARILGWYLRKNKLIPAKIFTSTLLRAVQTAEEVKKVLELDIPIEALELFNEIDYGPDENQPEEKIRARLGDDVMRAWEEEGLPPRGWKVDPTGLRALWSDFGARVQREFPEKNILLITHSGIARFSSVLTGDTYGLHTDELRLSSGGLGHFVYQGPQWECLGWNIKPELVPEMAEAAV